MENSSPGEHPRDVDLAQTALAAGGIDCEPRIATDEERYRILSKEFKTLLDAIPDKITLRFQRTYIIMILDASTCAARLTGELLQFSKNRPGKQIAVDRNNVIKSAEKFFKKVFNENIAVMIKLQEEPLLNWPTPITWSSW